MLIWKGVVLTQCNEDGDTIEDHPLLFVAPHHKPAHLYKKILAQLIQVRVHNKYDVVVKILQHFSINSRLIICLQFFNIPDNVF